MSFRKNGSGLFRRRALLAWGIAWLVPLILVSGARADYVGSLTNRIFLDPDSLPVLLDGMQAGDEISYILETTPADTGSVNGHAAWMTLYVPAGVEVIGAEVVKPIGGGRYSTVQAEDTDVAYNGWGIRGARGFAAPLAEGYLNEVQQDTGIFFSTDPRTQIVVGGLGPLSPTGINTNQLAGNLWDFDQTVAFGEGTALSGNQGKGSTPLVTMDGGATWVGTGSMVAGPDTYYTNDYDPDCDLGSATFSNDVACVGPWQRLDYPNSKLGGSGPIQPATATGLIEYTAVPATSNWGTLSPSNPLPPAVNAVRYVHGKRRLGELETGRITLRILDPVAFSATFQDHTFCLESTGGDQSDPSAKDNPWRYFEPQQGCDYLNPQSVFIKQILYVNGVPASGSSLSIGDVISYELTFANISPSNPPFSDMTNVIFTDSPADPAVMTLLEPGDPNCFYGSYDGDLPGPAPTYVGGSASGGTATWNAIGSFSSSSVVRLHLCGKVTGGALGARIDNNGQVDYVFNGQPFTETSAAGGTISTAISGSVWGDANGNGVLNLGEAGLGNVAVDLYLDNDGDGALSPGDTLASSTLTTVDGFYEFAGIAAGNYVVVESDPTDWFSTRDQDTAFGACGGGNGCNQISTTVAAGGASTGNDFYDAPYNIVTGTVFGDQDQDALLNLGNGDFGQGGVTVRIYEDTNGNGQVDPGTDLLFDTTTTAADGSYKFGVYDSRYVMDIDTATLPAGSNLTTDNVETAVFAGFGGTDPGNDFGFAAPPVLSVAKSSSAAGTTVAPGGTISYTIRPSYPSSQSLLTNVQVTDSVPANSTFVSAGPAGFTRSGGTFYWDLGSNAPKTAGVVLGVTGNCTFLPSQDTFIDENNPNSNYGGDNKLKIEARAGRRQRPMIQWSLATCIPAGAIVTSADMRFYVDKKFTNHTVDIYRITAAWLDTTATWNNTGGGNYNATSWGSFIPTTQKTYEVVPVTNLVQGWLAGLFPNHGVILVPTGPDGVTEIGSVEKGGKEPLLVVNYSLPGTNTQLDAEPYLVLHNDTINVKMNVTVDAADTVTPSALSVASVNGAGAASCGTPTPPSRVLAAGGTGDFLWTCTAVAGGLGGSVTFSTSITGTNPSLSYAPVTSNSVLVTPDLTMTVTAPDPIDRNVSVIDNTALLSSTGEFWARSTVRDVLSFGGTIGSLVWLDTDRDGLPDVGEPGLSNVEVVLYDVGPDGLPGTGDDIQVAMTTTALDGSYIFEYLSPGTYYVDVTDATVPAGLSVAPGNVDPSGTVTISTTETDIGVNFGYLQSDPTLGVLGSGVWSDANGDGLWGPGERGIGGVTVDLVTAGPDGVFGTGDDVVAATTTSAGDGSYLFMGVPAGEYQVDVTDTGNLLTGYSLTQGPQSNPDPTYTIFMETGQSYLNADFGYQNPALHTISDRLWFDSNGDGTLDAGESGVPGVQVDLLDASGKVIATTMTAADGTFAFPGVPDGSYSLRLPSDNGGSVTKLDGTTTPAINRLQNITVAGADVSGTSFGFHRPGIIGDTIFSDNNGNGTLDPGELGLPNITVQLWADSDGNGVFDSTQDTLVGSTTTDVAGEYRFSGLLDGTYFVSVDSGQVNLTGYGPTTTDQQTGANAAGVQIDAPLTSLASDFLDADFGFRNAGLPDVSGNVFGDLDVDGIDDGASEPGIGGVTVELLDSGGNVLATTTADANGDYSFPDVPAGNYRVHVTDQSKILSGYTLTRSLDFIDVTVAATNITKVDFGYVRDPATGGMGDRVWLDADNDGIQDAGEQGISGITVILYDPGPDGVPGGGDDVALSSMTTNSSGDFWFPNLPEGKYYVDVDGATLPAGLSPTAGTTDPSPVIRLSAGEQANGVDFGYSSGALLGTIGDTVFYDANGDGVQNLGEAGIGGVTLELQDAVCQPGVDCPTTVTKPDGSYLFTGVTPRAGGYGVQLDVTTLPVGYNPAPTNGPPFRSTWVGPGGAALDVDFGITGGSVGSIGDSVFFDHNGDGLFGAGDQGIEGITLNLVDISSGAIIATTTTDSVGAYDFTGIPAGTYQVEILDPTGVLAALNLSGGATNPTNPIPLLAGQDYNNADFPYASSGGLGIIGNLIWHDLNHNGVAIPLESGMELISVELWFDANANQSINPGTDNLVRLAWTDRNGNYEFTALNPGSYLVNVTDLHGVLGGFVKTVNGTTDLDNNSQVLPYPAVINGFTPYIAAPTSVVADFGYWAPLDLTLSGSIFWDTNSNASLDGGGGEPLINNTTLVLYRDLDGDGAISRGDPVIGQQQASAGTYSFTNLPAGDYIVAAETTGTSALGALQTTQTASGSVQPVTLAATDSTGNDFGFVFAATRVLIADFRASPGPGGNLRIEWTTVSEANTAGFELYRWIPGKNDFLRVTSSLVPAPFGSSQGSRYHVLDRVAPNGGENLRYMLVERETTGGENYYGPFTVSRRLGVISFRRPAGEEERSGATSIPPDTTVLRRNAEHRELAMSYRSEMINSVSKQIKVTIREEEGIYRVSSDELSALFGANIETVRQWIAQGRLAVENGGKPVAWLAADSNDGILFFGEKIGSIYSRDNVYWIRPGQGERMQRIVGPLVPPNGGNGGFVEHLPFEEDFFPVTITGPDPESDYWHWAGFIAGHGRLGSRSFSLNVPDVSKRARTAKLTVRFRGATSSPVAKDHHAEIWFNGSRIGETYFADTEEHEVTIGFSPTLLQSGSNTVTVVALKDTGAPSSQFFLDSFDLEYTRLYRAESDVLHANTGTDPITTIQGFTEPDILVFAYDKAEPRQPLVVASKSIRRERGGTYEVTFASPGRQMEIVALTRSRIRAPQAVFPDSPSSLKGDSGTDYPIIGADYLVITTGELLEAANALAEYRQGQGLESMVVDLEDIMDEFNDGIFNPHAVQDFLKYATENWEIPPRYVVLAGDGHLDYREIWNRGGNLIPPIMVSTPYGLFASDNSFADFDGDAVPDVAIGRLPVVTSGELSLMIDKITGYEASRGDWSSEALLIADNPDNGGNFNLHSDAFAGEVANKLDLLRIRLSEMTSSMARDALLDKIQSGVGLIHYVGHGGMDRLASEALLKTSDVDSLYNGDALTILLSMTCNVSRFELPGFLSLGEAMVLRDGGGAIAVWAPTGLSLDFEGAKLSRAFGRALNTKETGRLGDAVVRALVDFSQEKNFRFPLEVYILLGDPALNLKR